MIHDDIIGRQGRDRIDVAAAHKGFAKVTGPDAQVLNYDIVTGDNQSSANEGDARRRCSLACNRDVGIANGNLPAAKINHTTDLEDHDSPFVATAQPKGPHQAASGSATAGATASTADGGMDPVSATAPRPAQPPSRTTSPPNAAVRPLRIDFFSLIIVESPFGPMLFLDPELRFVCRMNELGLSLFVNDTGFL